MFDDDDAFVFNYFVFDLLLLIGYQSTLVLSFHAHTLHSVHYIALLSEEGVAQIRGPLNVAGQTFHQIGQCSHGLDVWILWLLRYRIDKRLILQPRILFQPLLQLHDLERISRRHERLAQQMIRIKRNRRHQRIQLIRRNPGGFLYRRLRCLSRK